MLQSNRIQVSPCRAAELIVYYWLPNVAGVLQAWGAVVLLTPLRNSAPRLRLHQIKGSSCVSTAIPEDLSGHDIISSSSKPNGGRVA